MSKLTLEKCLKLKKTLQKNRKLQKLLSKDTSMNIATLLTYIELNEFRLEDLSDDFSESLNKFCSAVEKSAEDHEEHRKYRQFAFVMVLTLLLPTAGFITWSNLQWNNAEDNLEEWDGRTIPYSQQKKATKGNSRYCFEEKRIEGHPNIVIELSSC